MVVTSILTDEEVLDVNTKIERETAKELVAKSKKIAKAAGKA